MTEMISYPTDDMSSTSRTLVSFLDDQWAQHTALFMNNNDSHAALLEGIARAIPQAGGKRGELASALQNYQQQYADCYQALRELAIQIDKAAQAMHLTDLDISSQFE